VNPAFTLLGKANLIAVFYGSSRRPASDGAAEDGCFSVDMRSDPVSELQPDVLGKRLGDARKLIEGKFLELGVGLGAAVEVIGALTEALDRLAAALDAEAVDRSAANLSDAAERLNDLASAHEGRSERFQRLAGAKAVLSERLTEMGRTLAYVRAFSMNIKITAAGIPGAASEFDSFSEEIRSALEAARGQLDEFEARLADLSLGVDQAARQQTELGSKCAAMLPALPNRLQADAAAMASHHKSTASLAVELGGVARRIQGQVGFALAALQIGDTARQRIEHVETGLEILARSPDRAAAAVVYGLLADQLQDTAEQMGAEVDRLSASLSGVAADARELLRLHHAAGGARAGTRAEEAGVLHKLEASISDAMGLVAEIEKGDAAADAIGRSAEQTAAGLVERVNTIRAVRMSIHFLALNAHLKCCHLGASGGPLSVVAAELRLRAGDLDGAADAVEAKLAELGGAETAQAHARGRDSSAIGRLLEEAIAPVRAAAASAGRDLKALADQGEAVSRELDQAVSRLNFQADVIEVLYDGADQMQAAAGEPEGVSEAEAQAVSAVLAEIGALYSMARERTIHAAHAEKVGAGVPAAQAACAMLSFPCEGKDRPRCEATGG
jgi:hypothetical protein